MLRGTWWATVHSVAKSQTPLSDSLTHTHTHTHTETELLALANSDSQSQSQTTWTTGWGPWRMAPELPTALGKWRADG